MSAPSPLAEIPNDCSKRLLLLRDVIAQWYAPLQPGDGIPADDGVPLPAALREWYALAGNRSDIWSRQDHLLRPSELRQNGDFQVFMVENQDVVEWGIRSAEITANDPPVYVSSLADPEVWTKENDTVSEFALQMFAYCLKWSDKCRWWANAYVGADVLRRVASTYPRLPFPEWHWPASTQFFGLRDIVIEVQVEPDHDDAWLYVVTRTSAAADSFKDLIGPLNIGWNARSEEWPPGWVSAAEDLGS